jgi:hypothetical protein
MGSGKEEMKLVIVIVIMYLNDVICTERDDVRQRY